MTIREFYKNKKVLITGHTGFKGAWLSQILLDFKAKIFGYALKPNTIPNLYTIIGLKEQIREVNGDIRDLIKFNQVVKEFKPDIIFHLAAQPLVRESYDNPHYTYETNVMGTVNVLEAIKINKIRTGIIITTDKVYCNIEKDVQYKEDDPLGGYDPYSNSKACADLIVQSYIQSFFNSALYPKKHETLLASARAGNVIGGGDWAKDRIIPDAIRAFFEDKKDLVIRNPEAIRPWQHVFESLYGYLLLGQHLANGEVDKINGWNFGPRPKDMLALKKVLDMLIKNFGHGRYIAREDKTKHEATNLKLDSSKAREKLNWQPKYNLEKAVSETAIWYKEYYSNPRNIKNLTMQQIREYFKDI